MMMKQRTQAMTEQEYQRIRKQGFDAFFSCAANGVPPYPLGSEQELAWIEGYEEAYFLDYETA